jgi:hypothetical protein
MPSRPCTDPAIGRNALGRRGLITDNFLVGGEGSGEVFEVGFTVKNSLVMRKYTGFGIEGARIDAFSPSAVWFDEQEHWGRGNTPESVAAGWSTSELFRYYRFTVRMTPQATAEERRRYTAFDYGCLWRYRGCKDARELLPTADRFSVDE